MSDRFDPYYTWLGIPPREQPANRYRLLSLEAFEDNPDVISNAADRQMLHVRTFQTGRHAAVSQRVLNELAAARMCLLDPQQKAEYDRELKRRMSASGAEASPGPATPPPVPPPARPERQIAPPPPPVSSAGETRLAPPSSAAPCSQPERIAARPPDAPDTRPQAVPTGAPSVPPASFASPAGSRSLRRRRPPSALPLLFGIGLLAAIFVVAVGVALSRSSPDRGRNSVAGGNSVDSDVLPANSSARADKSRADQGGNSAAKRAAGTRDAAGKTRAASGADNTIADDAHLPFTVAVSAGEEESARGAAVPDRRIDLELETREAGRGETSTPEKVESPPLPAALKPVTPVSAPKRHGVPIGEALATARATYDAAYAETIAKVKTLEEKTALADLLIRDAAESRFPAAARYVMLDAAGRYAAESGDYRTAKRAVDALAVEYEVDALKLRARLLVEAAENARTPEAYRDIALAALDDIPPLIAAHHFEEARELAGKAQFIAARRLKEVPLRQRANEADAEIRRQQVLWREVQKAREKLAEAPSDGEAHLIVGRYLCGVAGDWSEGLSHLSRSADLAWKSAAIRDRAVPGTPPQQLALADAWYELAGRSPGFPGLFARAGEWYRRAQASAAAGDQIRIQQRLDAILARRLPTETVTRAALGDKTAAAPSVPKPVAGSAAPHARPRIAVSVEFRESLGGHTAAVRGLAFSPDGARLASVGDDATLRLWDVRKVAALLTVKAHDTQAAEVAFSHGGARLASSGDRAAARVVALWDDKFNSLTVFDAPGEPLQHPLFLPHDESLAVARGDDVELLDLEGSSLGMSYSHAAAVRAIALSPRGMLLASGDERGVVKLYDLGRGEIVHSIRAHAAPVAALGFSSDGRKLAAATAEGGVKLFDAGTAAPLASFSAGPLTDLAFIADDNGIATAGNRELLFWDTDRGRRQAALPAHAAAITALAVSPDGRLIATGGDDDQIKLWSVTVSK